MSAQLEATPERGLVTVHGPLNSERTRILSPAALDFLAALHHRFDAHCLALLARRRQRQRDFDAGKLPDFRADTRAIRESDWRVAPIPESLCDRRVEITGPVERKMVINALNSGARVFMADFEDSNAPTFANLIDGQINLRDAVDGSIAFRQADGREYRLGARPATLIVRPRGWHLPEPHLTVDGHPLSGALVDFGLFAFHNARALQASGRGPFFYLPKLESMEEAALWDQVMAWSEDTLGLPAGCMKTTVLIETLPAAFEMDEILHALRTRVVGLNCGRWDYIFSFIKTCRADRSRVLPERGQVAMTVPFLRAYSRLLIRTCHRRGALAMGGMAAQIPIKGDASANTAALDKVRADKLREVRDGHDGTWVAHPALVPVAMQVFDAHMPGRNQLERPLDDDPIDRDQLLAPCPGTITREGFDNNVEVALRYLAAWMDGQGCVPIHHLMEDAATAEIARAQLWQWLHHDGLEFTDHAPIDMALFERVLCSHVHRLRGQDIPGVGRLDDAAVLLAEVTRSDTLAEFITLPALNCLRDPGCGA